MAGITALNKNGRYAFGGGGSYLNDAYQGGSGAPGSAEAGKPVGSVGGPSYDSGPDLPPGYYEKKQKEFEYNVDKRKLKRPGDTKHLKNKTIPDAYSLYYKGVPKSTIPYFGTYLNMAAPFRNKMLRKNIDYFLSPNRVNIDRNKYPDTLEGYKKYIGDRLSGSITASGNTIYNTGGDGNDGSTPMMVQPSPSMPGETEEENEFTYRFGDEQGVGDDVTQGYYAANGGRVPRAFGGIMDTATGRRAYGLGSLFKSVKKAASKVLKSPLGKAAILGLGGYALGGGFTAGGFGSNALGGFMKSIGQKALLKDGMTKFTLGNLHLGKLGILGASALPFFMKQPENPDIGMSTRGGSLIDPLTGKEGTPQSMRENIELAKLEAAGDPDKLDALNQAYNNMLFTTKPYENYGLYANGGRIGKAEGGLMNLGGMEKDYRAEGGFVPIGKAEKADDVPARLSVNEFVFTADAVRNAGGGDIDKGAEVMENMMKNLENGGRVSEESQGNTGAQEMFSVSERIGEVI